MRFKKLLEGLNVQPIIDILNAHPDLWKEITLRQQYQGTAHSDTETVFLRGPEAFTFEKYQFDIGAFNYPALSLFVDALNPVMAEIDRITQCTQYGRMLIVKLQPGGLVDEHVDEGTYAEFYSRFHLGIVCPEGSELIVEDEKAHIKQGEFWWFEHRRPHWAVNDSDTDRIHLIIDMVSPLFEVSNVQTKQEEQG